MVGAVGQPHPFQCLAGQQSDILISGVARVQQRQFDVFKGGGPGQEVEALEHEADLLVADVGQLVAVQVVDMDAVQKIIAAAGIVQAAEDVQHGRFSRSGRAHDRHQFAGIDDQVDAFQGFDLDFAAVINFGHPLGADDGFLVVHVTFPEADHSIRMRGGPCARPALPPTA